ncbi:MAG TPA: glycosyltransferase family 2 protein [Puia sp.]|nr:glycosyltransferase family 2 protein [Puia sp.]
MVKFLFFFSLFIIFYSYIGYGIVIYLLVKLKRLFRSKTPSGISPLSQSNPGQVGKKGRQPLTDFEPDVTLVVAAYNEADCIERKLRNSLDLDYPAGKLRWIFITDGSTDATTDIIRRYNGILLLHQAERKGKVAAINRAMKYVETPYVIFSDANSLMNQTAVKEIMKHYADPLVGAVAGEKKIISKGIDQAVGSGESIYWKYESVLKKLDSEFHTVVGAAGELFSIKTSHFHEVAENVIIEDFVLSLKICLDGYVVRYEPGAYATETASVSMREEQKRKVRIAAGAFQAMIILKKLFNVYKYPLLSFQFISHRILRWTLCPVCLIICFFTNVILVAKGQTGFYVIFLTAQVVFYTIAVSGWLFARRNLKIKAFYIPYYFFFMNLSMFPGFFRFISGKQPVTWDKSSREIHQ